jgi:Ca2+/Na+ antiporter
LSEEAQLSDVDDAEGIDWKGLGVAIASLVVCGIAFAAQQQLLFLGAAATAISILIWQACDPFAEAAQWIGTTWRLPGSVRGATLDAIASSMPELFSGIFFVVIALGAATSGDAAAVAAAGAEGYGSTIATCAGSAIYNMILIPAVVALVVSYKRKEKPVVEVEKEVILRDGLWFLGCEMVLLVFLYQNVMYWWMALVLIALYACYTRQLFLHARRHQRALDILGEDGQGDDDLADAAPIFFNAKEVPLNKRNAWLIIIVCTILAAIACYFLVEITREAAVVLNVPIFFVAVILAAAVSSVPDTFLSIGAAMRGDDSGAVSNAFGSNIFDICICLSIPLLVNAGMTGWQPVSMLQDGQPIPGLVGLRILLWVLTGLTLVIIWHKQQLTRNKAILLCFLYLVFVAYAILGSLNILKL